MHDDRNLGWGGGGDIQHPARSVLGLAEAPVQWIPGLFRGKRPARDVDHTSPSNTEVKERVEIQLYSTLWPSMIYSRVTFYSLFREFNQIL
jgi:hypothetical protein